MTPKLLKMKLITVSGNLARGAIDNGELWSWWIVTQIEPTIHHCDEMTRLRVESRRACHDTESHLVIIANNASYLSKMTMFMLAL